MRPDDGLALVLIHDDIAGHVPYGGRGHQQQRFGMGQVAELYRVIIREILAAPVTDDFTDAAVTGYSEIIFSNGALKLRQYLIVGFAGFGLVIRNKFTGGLRRTAGNEQQAYENNKTFEHYWIFKEG